MNDQKPKFAGYQVFEVDEETSNTMIGQVNKLLLSRVWNKFKISRTIQIILLFRKNFVDKFYNYRKIYTVLKTKLLKRIKIIYK